MPRVRGSHQPADPAADCRPGARPASEDPIPGAGTPGSRPQGGIRRALSAVTNPGLLPGSRRRCRLWARRSPQAKEARAPYRRSRCRPIDRQQGIEASTHRQCGDRPGHRPRLCGLGLRRSRGRRSREGTDLLRASGLPEGRTVVRRTRTTLLFVQLSFWSMPRMLRFGNDARGGH